MLSRLLPAKKSGRRARGRRSRRWITTRARRCRGTTTRGSSGSGAMSGMSQAGCCGNVESSRCIRVVSVNLYLHAYSVNHTKIHTHAYLYVCILNTCAHDRCAPALLPYDGELVSLIRLQIEAQKENIDTNKKQHQVMCVCVVCDCMCVCVIIYV